MINRNQMDKVSYHEKYFRPSCMKTLNVRFNTFEFFSPYSDKTPDQINLPIELTNNPEDTILNYFSILRDAENLYARSCGTVGFARMPFPIAYNFLSKEYQKKLSYDDYLNSFAGIGHTSLIKLCQVPDVKRRIKFFYEIETIEGFVDKKGEYFGYYYGLIELVHEREGYRIIDIRQFPEDFLCAPYHGWSHDGEAVVKVKYGGWCKLVQKSYPPVVNGYVKKIYFHGNDGTDYCIIFFTLTNGTDVEVAQFRKTLGEMWKQTDMNPEKDCLPKVKNEDR